MDCILLNIEHMIDTTMPIVRVAITILFDLFAILFIINMFEEMQGFGLSELTILQGYMLIIWIAVIAIKVTYSFIYFFVK